MLLRGVDYGVEFGLGCDIYLPYFKLCPELKFCFGLADVLEPDRSDLANPLDRVYSQALSRAIERGFSPVSVRTTSQTESEREDTCVGLAPSQMTMYWQMAPDCAVMSTVTMLRPFFS